MNLEFENRFHRTNDAPYRKVSVRSLLFFVADESHLRITTVIVFEKALESMCYSDSSYRFN